MGTIYEALRVDKEFTKRAAIKVVTVERQPELPAVGPNHDVLDHPIAQLTDGVGDPTEVVDGSDGHRGGTRAP